ncbi:MAG: histidinol-phosphatase [Actinomycetaceae bacterium]|nr:histidinol-phosphatase [Actinomycetaceae bacterium]
MLSSTPAPSNPHESSLTSDCAIALELADIADNFTYPAFMNADFHVERKADMTLVTEADRGTEDALRARLAVLRPDDAILGEERGTSTSSHNRRWIIDPIDGTHNYVRGVPVWATLIALEVNGNIEVGVVSAPALNRRWYGARGQGAFRVLGTTPGCQRGAPKPLSVSRVAELSDASLSYSSLHGWKTQGLDQGFHHLMQRMWRTRAYGDFWSYMLLAEGSVDIAAEPDLELYDMAALVPIVTEAGGTFTDLQGSPGPWGAAAVATNTLLHTAALNVINSPHK